MKLIFPKEKRNLIHIYLESIETTYLSKELGGYMKTNLMPELTQLAGGGRQLFSYAGYVWRPAPDGGLQLVGSRNGQYGIGAPSEDSDEW